MVFKINAACIPQILACIEAFNVCFFHGDGNMYDNENDSNFRKDFSNPKNEGAAYRIKFTHASQVPTNVDDLSKKLFEARNADVIAAAKGKEVSPTKTLTVKKAEGEEASKLQVKQPGAEGSGSAAAGGGAAEVVKAKPYNQRNKTELMAELALRDLPVNEVDTKNMMIEQLEADDAKKAEGGGQA